MLQAGHNGQTDEQQPCRSHFGAVGGPAALGHLELQFAVCSLQAAGAEVLEVFGLVRVVCIVRVTASQVSTRNYGAPVSGQQPKPPGPRKPEKQAVCECSQSRREDLAARGVAGGGRGVIGPPYIRCACSTATMARRNKTTGGCWTGRRRLMLVAAQRTGTANK